MEKVQAEETMKTAVWDILALHLSSLASAGAPRLGSRVAPQRHKPTES